MEIRSLMRFQHRHERQISMRCCQIPNNRHNMTIFVSIFISIAILAPFLKTICKVIIRYNDSQPKKLIGKLDFEKRVFLFSDLKGVFTFFDPKRVFRSP